MRDAKHDYPLLRQAAIRLCLYSHIYPIQAKYATRQRIQFLVESAVFRPYTVAFMFHVLAEYCDCVSFAQNEAFSTVSQYQLQRQKRKST
jgi:hypothetical protein